MFLGLAGYVVQNYYYYWLIVYGLWKCAESKFKNFSEWMLVSPTFIKKAIWEKTFKKFKIWGLINQSEAHYPWCQYANFPIFNFSKYDLIGYNYYKKTITNSNSNTISLVLPIINFWSKFTLKKNFSYRRHKFLNIFECLF